MVLVGAVAFIAGLEIRRRLRRAVALALALVLGVLGALVLSILAGARRTGSSLDRFRTWSRSADLELSVSAPSSSQLKAFARVPSGVAVADLPSARISTAAASEVLEGRAATR